MRSHLVRNAAAVGVLFAMGAVAQAQNLLTNGTLDATSVTTMANPSPTSWDAFSSRNFVPFNDGLSSEPWCNVADPGGFGTFFKPFQGNPATVGKIFASLSQSVPGAPGLPYTMTGFAGAEANYIGLSDPTVQSQFKLEFLAANNAVISGVTLDLVPAGLGVPNGQPFQYKQFSLNGVSPANTAFVRVSAIMGDAYGNPLGGGQAYVVDNFSLTVPEPTSLAFLGLAGVMCVRRRK